MTATTVKYIALAEMRRIWKCSLKARNEIFYTHQYSFLAKALGMFAMIPLFASIVVFLAAMLGFFALMVVPEICLKTTVKYVKILLKKRRLKNNREFYRKYYNRQENV